jgi:hypothetical protein
MLFRGGGGRMERHMEQPAQQAAIRGRSAPDFQVCQVWNPLPLPEPGAYTGIAPPKRRSVSELQCKAVMVEGSQLSGPGTAVLDVREATQFSVAETPTASPRLAGTTAVLVVGMETITQNRGPGELHEHGHRTRQPRINDTNMQRRGSLDGRAVRGWDRAFWESAATSARPMAGCPVNQSAVSRP